MPITPRRARGTPGGRQSKSVTITYGAVSAVLLLVIASVALIVQPPSPPALAEFAPQPDKTIDEGPDDQSSQFGSGGSGACTGGQVGCEGVGRTTTTLPEDDDDGPSQTVIDKARVRRCVGDPPRQIEDPQSPPCAPYWEGPDNGGATSKGVTRDEIRVAVTKTGLMSIEQMQELADFFNRRFELYGRHLTVVEVPAMQPAPTAQRDTAERTVELQPFAAIAFAPREDLSPFRTRLADARIVSISPDDLKATEAELRALHPYAWNYGMLFDQASRDLVEFACRSLAGHSARYGGTDVQQKTRSFAVVVMDSKTQELHSPDSRILHEGLRACAPVTVRTAKYVGTKEGDGTAADQQAFMNGLREDGVTTLVMAPASVAGILQLMEAANAVDWSPEWLLPGGGDSFLLNEEAYAPAPAEQLAHLMAMGGRNKGQRPADRPSVWAMQEQGIDSPHGTQFNREIENRYQALLVLASGIQAAGPGLTPETFAKGLQSLRFPNPGAGAAPYYQATVGFTGDHSMIDDEALQWWSASAPAYYSLQPVGGWCYVDQGARWRLGQWPNRPDAFFDADKPCR